MRIAAIIALLLSSSTALLADSKLEADLEAAKERVAKMEAELFAKEPLLKEAEAEYARMGKQTAADIKLGGRVSDFLQAGGDPAKEKYKNLRSWAMNYSKSQLVQDPRHGPILKSLLATERRFREGAAKQVYGDSATPDQIDDLDKLWNDFVAQQVRLEPHYKSTLERYEKDSGFPDYVLEYTRLAAQSKMLGDFLYFPYLQLKIPRELRDARAQVVNLTREAEINRRD
jgi:hypothetical protein